MFLGHLSKLRVNSGDYCFLFSTVERKENDLILSISALEKMELEI